MTGTTRGRGPCPQPCGLTSITDGGNLGCGDDEALLCRGDGIDETHVDAGWAVNDDELVTQRHDVVTQLLHMPAGNIVPDRCNQM